MDTLIIILFIVGAILVIAYTFKVASILLGYHSSESGALSKLNNDYTSEKAKTFKKKEFSLEEKEREEKSFKDILMKHVEEATESIQILSYITPKLEVTFRDRYPEYFKLLENLASSSSIEYTRIMQLPDHYFDEAKSRTEIIKSSYKCMLSSTKDHILRTYKSAKNFHLHFIQNPNISNTLSYIIVDKKTLIQKKINFRKGQLIIEKVLIITDDQAKVKLDQFNKMIDGNSPVKVEEYRDILNELKKETEDNIDSYKKNSQEIQSEFNRKIDDTIASNYHSGSSEAVPKENLARELDEKIVTIQKLEVKIKKKEKELETVGQDYSRLISV